MRPIPKCPLCEVVSSKNLGEHLAAFVGEDEAKMAHAGVLLICSIVCTQDFITCQCVSTGFQTVSWTTLRVYPGTKISGLVRVCEQGCSDTQWQKAHYLGAIRHHGWVLPSPRNVWHQQGFQERMWGVEKTLWLKQLFPMFSMMLNRRLRKRGKAVTNDDAPWKTYQV